MDDEYVCPECGEPARGASVCGRCGTDLDAVRHLPWRSEYERARHEHPEQSTRQALDAVHAETLAAVESEAREHGEAGRPAGVWIRWGARLVDRIVQIAGPLIVGLPFLAISRDAFYVVVGIGLLAAFLLYEPLMLAYAGGQSLGKRAMQIRVELAAGEPIGLGRAVVREVIVFNLFMIFSIPLLISAVFAASSAQRISLHDRICGTRVVKTV